MNQYTRMWRTLVRVVSVENDKVKIVLPAFSVDKELLLNKEEIPFSVAEGQRLHAHANIGAEGINDIVFSDWEDK